MLQILFFPISEKFPNTNWFEGICYEVIISVLDNRRYSSPVKSWTGVPLRNFWILSCSFDRISIYVYWIFFKQKHESDKYPNFKELHYVGWGNQLARRVRYLISKLQRKWRDQIRTRLPINLGFHWLMTDMRECKEMWWENGKGTYFNSKESYLRVSFQDKCVLRRFYRTSVECNKETSENCIVNVCSCTHVRKV